MQTEALAVTRAEWCQPCGRHLRKHHPNYPLSLHTPHPPEMLTLHTQPQHLLPQWQPWRSSDTTTSKYSFVMSLGVPPLRGKTYLNSLKLHQAKTKTKKLKQTVLSKRNRLLFSLEERNFKTSDFPTPPGLLLGLVGNCPVSGGVPSLGSGFDFHALWQNCSLAPNSTHKLLSWFQSKTASS